MERLLPALSGKIKEGKSDHKSYTQAILPRKTGKEKNRCRAGSFVRPKWIFKDCGGFEYIKAAVPYALDKGVTTTR